MRTVSEQIQHLQWLRTLPRRPLIVAEVKSKTPFSNWTNPYSLEEQAAICEAIGDVISVHTSDLWGGSYQMLTGFRTNTSKPILAKGFHPTVAHVKKALDFGAHYVLTVGWHDGQENCWHECESLHDVIYSDAKWVVWNARDPRTGKSMQKKWANVERVKAVRLSGEGTEGHNLVCQASRIRCAQDVSPFADAILIGEGLYI